MVVPLLGETLEVEDSPGMVCNILSFNHFYIFYIFFNDNITILGDMIERLDVTHLL